MPSAFAAADPNPTRTDLRLVVLGQWVQAGRALVLGAATGRGLVAGAIRLAILLMQRLSELRGVLARVAAASGAAAPSAPTPAFDWSFATGADDPHGRTACLYDALVKSFGVICDLTRPPAAQTRHENRDIPPNPAGASELLRAPGRRSCARRQPSDPPLVTRRRRAPWRRPGAVRRLQSAPTPLAASAGGRLRVSEA
jgi:hypothetical protein